jgi:hypothetical protein
VQYVDHKKNEYLVISDQCHSSYKELVRYGALDSPETSYICHLDQVHGIIHSQILHVITSITKTAYMSNDTTTLKSHVFKLVRQAYSKKLIMNQAQQDQMDSYLSV